MQPRLWALWMVATALTLGAEARAQQGIRWEESSIEAAQRRAAQTRRLVLVHFWSASCSPCMKMERNVFSQPDVGAAVEANYVPVKVNADQFPHTCRQYGITALPTDIVLTPSGQMVRRFQGAVPATNYVGQLNQVAAEMNLGPPAAVAQAPIGPRSPEPGPQEPDRGTYREARPSPEFAMQNFRDRPPSLAERPSPQAPIGPGDMTVPSPRTEPRDPTAFRDPIAPRAPSAPAGVPPTGPSEMAAPGNPPLGLEGYCPVELAEKRRWVLGTHPWGVIHQGRTYMCAGPDEQKRFLEAPERYAPVIAGNDVVMSLERGQSVPGRREHGVFYRGRVYLFAEEGSLQAFSRDPRRYADQVLQTMRTDERAPRR